MFKRKAPLSIGQKIKEFFWPSMGWRRFFVYLKHKTVRLSDSPHRIAMGLACGAGVSFSPIMTTHLLQAAILAFFLRGNIPASLIGTIVGNPWTFPFIWWASITVGTEIFHLMGISATSNIPEDVTLTMLWDMLWTEPLRLILPWLLGGYILCAVAVILSYPLYLNLIKGAKLARQKARQKVHVIRAHKDVKQMTGQKR